MRFFFYVSILTIFLKCRYESENDQRKATKMNSIHKTDSDTLVFSKKTPDILSTSDFDEVIYALIVNGDASSIYCRMATSKKRDQINMYWSIEDINKMYNNIDLQDSSTKIMNSINKKKDEDVSYKKYIDNIKYIFRYISKIKKLDSLKNFELRLLTLNDLLPELNEMSERRFNRKV